jgi:hypothetical protein
VFVGPAPRCDVRIAGLGTSFLRGHLCDPVWAAPEAYTPSPASDVYSAALLTVYASCGGLPSDPASVVNLAARDIVGNGPPAATVDSRLAGPLTRALEPAAEGRHRSVGELARSIAEALGSSFALSGAWQAAAPPPAPMNEAEALPIPPPPLPLPLLPPAATSVDALTTSASGPVPRSLLGSRAKLALLVAAGFIPVIIGVVMITSVVNAPPKPVASPPASSPPVNAPAPAPVPVPVPVPIPAPNATPDTPPNTKDEPPPTPSSEATLVVDCTPECASITVDGTPAEPTSTQKPGAHVVVVKRGLHGPQTKYVKLSAGRQTTISFIWWKTPPGPPKGFGGGGKKPCGKFLQRCD